MTTDITELVPAMKAAAELITSGYSRKWIVSHDDETCWVGANDDDGNLTPFIEVSIADWSGNKVDNETLARFISLCRPANILALVEALEKAQAVMNAVVTAAAIRGVRPFDGIDCDPPTLEENAEACGDAMSARIRELEANPPKPHHNGLMQISNELASAKQRIAELESRTVSVKLLTPEVRNALKAEGLSDVLKDAAEYAPLTAGQWETLTKNWYQTFIGLSGSAAGIKVEAE